MSFQNETANGGATPAEARGKAHFSLPGLFEFYDFYTVFLPLFRERREYFYEWCDVTSVYGAPEDCLWGGGRMGVGNTDVRDVLALTEEYGVSARLTFSNSLLKKEHLSDARCNALCRALDGGRVQNGVIVHADALLDYLQKTYKNLYFVSSTTKVLTDFSDLKKELARPEFACVVPDFRLNKSFDNWRALAQKEKDKVEFLCNECCYFGCLDRKECYETVSRQTLGEDCPDHVCAAPDGKRGYRFSAAMKNPGFIGVDDIRKTYLPMGFFNYKIEGRTLGSALLLEFILHYLTKPEYRLNVREEIYLDATLDLF